jgi:DNA-binding CsgD family transcriptional regulator
MLTWDQIFQQLRQIINATIRMAKSRRREQIAIALATTFIAISFSFNKWLPEILHNFVDPWRGNVIVPIISFALGLVALGYGIYRIWKLVFVPDLPPPANRPSAIKGPLAFTPSDGDLFRKLGREDELRKLFGFVQDDQITMVVLMGASGAGKTSLLRAGLTDILKGTEINYHYWEAVPSESGQALLTVVQQSQRFQSDEGDLNSANQNASGLRSLDELVNSPSELGSHVIVIDQFEQLGTAANGQVFRLLRKIAREAKPPHRVTWVIAFRREYRANWSDFIIPEHERGFFPREISLQLFTSEQARDVTSQLIQAAGLSVEQKVINNLIGAATVDGEVSSVDIGIGLLVLSELYERQGAKTVTQDVYHFAGGAEGLLTQYISRCLDSFPDEDRKSLLSAMLALREAETNQRIAQGKTSDELAAEIEVVSIRRLKNHLERLTQRDIRLLEHIGGSKDEIRYRLPHERLIPALNRLAGKLIGEIEEAKVRFAGAFAAWKSNRSSQYLLRGRGLRLVDRYKNKIPWGSEKAEKLAFLRRSKGQRALTRAGYAGSIILIASLAGILYWTILNGESWQNEYPTSLTDYQRRVRILDLDNSFYSENFDFLDSDTLEELHVKMLDWRDSKAKGLTKGLSKCPKIKSLFLNAGYSGTDVIDLSSLPNSLTALSFSVSRGEPALVLPKNLRQLSLDVSYTTEKELPVLPNTLHDLSLTVGNSDLLVLPEMPSELTKLTLDLSKSEIETLPLLPDTLTDLTLRISESAVRDLPPLPNGLTALSLDISKSKVKELPALPNSLSKLTLILSGNEALPPLPGNLTELSLSLSFNQMESLQPLPNRLTKLSLPLYEGLTAPQFPKGLKALSLNLVYSEMEKLPPLPNSLTALSLNLALQGNRMEKLPVLANNLTELSLDLSYSRVKELPVLPDNLKALTLNLSNSRIQTLPPLPSGLTKLILDLDTSKVKELPPLPNTLADLTLNLQHSDLPVLPSFPSNLTALALNLSYGKIIQLPHLPETLADLTLNLKASKVTRLPSFSQTNCQNLLLELTTDQRMSLNAIPKSVTHLKF